MRISGFNIRVDASWIFLAILITWSLATGLFPAYYEDLPVETRWIMAGIGAMGLFASIILHEIGHSLVARRAGMPVHDITLFLFGGVAEMDEEPPDARAELAMALAGPCTSFVIGGIFIALWQLFKRSGIGIEAQAVAGYLGGINILLGLFNLLPAFPLDGGRVLRALLWMWQHDLRKATRIASHIGAGFGIALMVLAVLAFLGGNFIGGLWWLMLGFFMRAASRLAWRQLLVRRVLQGETVRRFMKTGPVTVAPHITIRDLVENNIYKFHYKMYPVVENGVLAGCITTRDIHDLNREEWDRHTVREYMHHCGPERFVTPDTDAMDALSKMNKTGNSRLMVVEDENQLAGVLALKDMMAFLSLKLDLEEERA
jgi:Zn-dependent protease/CBS domain-containing protein